MALLHKSDTIGDISTTRPITILATMYRLWAKIMTNKMLKHVAHALPVTLYGSVPGRCAGDMVAAVQTKLERALLSGNTMLGVSLDFSKAYNTLPRDILEAINSRLGFQKLWMPYSKFLESLQRFFTCGNHWGPGLNSEIGVPEGCPIAVVQMILLTWTFTLALRHYSKVDLYSYVDDWVILASDRNALRDAISYLQTLAQKFGLILSLAKSGIFATDHHLAKKVQGQWAGQGIHIGMVKNFKGLGVNFQTCPQIGTQVRNSRWQSARVMLNRLQYMPWTQQVKTQILKRAIMPHVFYGAQTWATGKDFLREVRAKCNHAVWGKKMYHLHYLTPIFSGTCYEPMLHVAGYRFSAFLRMVARDLQMVKEVWKLAVEQKAYFKRKTRGVISLFQQQLSDLGWQIHSDGTCISLGGWSFLIWEVSAKQFIRTFEADWEEAILQHLRTKQNLHDIQTICFQRSQFPPMPDPMLEGFMRKVRLGGMFPHKRKGHITGEDGLCDYCGMPDTLKHRFFDCPAVDSVRLTQEWQDIQHEPHYVLLAGLFPRLPLVEDYCQLLDAIPPPAVVLPEDPPERFQIFTDGSALDNDSPQVRLCSWAVTWALDEGAANRVLASGLLPGRSQSVFRAEFQAVFTAIVITNSADIYCDNQAVVTIVNQLIAFGYVEERWAAHESRDLIRATARALAARPPGSFAVYWIKAHRKPSDARGERDLWMIIHNEVADTAAKASLRDLPPQLQAIRLQIQGKLQHDLLLRNKISKTLRLIMDEYQ